MNIFYNRLARLYNVFSRPERRLVFTGLAGLYLKDNESFLEIGCGTGYAIEEISRFLTKNGMSVGIDSSPRMLRIASERLKTHNIISKPFFIQTDALRLPFRNSKFDAIFSSFTIELFSDAAITSVLKECSRVLKPDGRISFVSLSIRGDHTWMMSIYEWCGRIFPNWIDCRPIDLHFYLSETGFQVMDCAIHSLWGLPVEIVHARKDLSDDDRYTPVRPAHA